MQALTNKFAEAVKCYGLSINLKNDIEANISYYPMFWLHLAWVYSCASILELQLHMSACASQMANHLTIFINFFHILVAPFLMRRNWIWNWRSL